MNQILQWVNKIMSSNLKLSWVRHFGALSGNVFQFQSDMSSICINHFSEKLENNSGGMSFTPLQD